MIRAIAFDWGGIFTEGTFDSCAVENLAKLAGVSQDEIATTYFPLMEHFEVGAFDFETFHRKFVERSGFELDAQAFRETFLGSVRERTAMFAVLGSIPLEYTVGMLSNNVPVLCDHVRDDTRMGRIEHFVFSNEIGVRKPDPAAFAALTEAIGTPPQGTVFIDDNHANIDAAKELGYDGILLDTLEGFMRRWRERFPELATGLEIS